MKKLVAQEAKKMGPARPNSANEDDGKDGDDDDGEMGPRFPNPKTYLMIFVGTESRGSRRAAKVAHREVFAMEPTTPHLLWWSELPITFDRSDHPSHVQRPGRYPLVVDPIIDKTRLSKVLTDGGSGLNVMYVETLNAIRVDKSHIRPNGSPFHGVVPGMQAVPIGQIDLPVTFGTPSNYRMETLTFEVVGFPGA